MNRESGERCVSVLKDARRTCAGALAALACLLLAAGCANPERQWDLRAEDIRLSGGPGGTSMSLEGDAAGYVGGSGERREDALGRALAEARSSSPDHLWRRLWSCCVIKAYGLGPDAVTEAEDEDAERWRSLGRLNDSGLTISRLSDVEIRLLDHMLDDPDPEVANSVLWTMGDRTSDARCGLAIMIELERRAFDAKEAPEDKVALRQARTAARALAEWCRHQPGATDADGAPPFSDESWSEDFAKLDATLWRLNEADGARLYVLALAARTWLASVQSRLPSQLRREGAVQ